MYISKAIDYKTLLILYKNLTTTEPYYLHNSRIPKWGIPLTVFPELMSGNIC